MADTRADFGLLALRLGIGGTLIAHGSQKLFGWFGGHGIAGTTGAMQAMGFTPAKPSAIAAGVGEAGGGALLVLGLATPAAGAAVAGTMASAAAVHAPSGFFAMSGGLEYPAVLGLAGTALALTGPGRLSLDHATGHVFNKSWMTAVGLVGGSAVTAYVLSKRSRSLKSVPADAVAEAESAPSAS